jgi:hypothetical protein
MPNEYQGSGQLRGSVADARRVVTKGYDLCRYVYAGALHYQGAVAWVAGGQNNQGGALVAEGVA